ncbi:class I glutamine amidotransferase-like protein [Phlegmacium glaucopus]|nr:class I glutamine amidotransferase-like protein [Phlegmacium glaucopus]
MNSTTTTRIALLKCGDLRGKAYERNSGYNEIYNNWLQISLPDPQVNKFSLDSYDVVQDIYPNEDLYECIMLTGSAASAYEDIQWINKLARYIAHVAESKPHIKIIGICFGHQIISRALGGECVPFGEKWELGPTPIELTDIGKQLFGPSDTLNIQQMHRDHVPSVPPSFHLLGYSLTCYNQGMVRFSPGAKPSTPLPPIQILTTQGHPEFNEPIVTAIIEQRLESGSISPEAAADAETRRFWRTDGVDVIGKAIWAILLRK